MSQTESGKKGPVPERSGPERPTLKSKKTPILCWRGIYALKGLAVCVFNEVIMIIIIMSNFWLPFVSIMLSLDINLNERIICLSSG